VSGQAGKEVLNRGSQNSPKEGAIDLEYALRWDMSTARMLQRRRDAAAFADQSACGLPRFHARAFCKRTAVECRVCFYIARAALRARLGALPFRVVSACTQKTSCGVSRTLVGGQDL
jgi:hypothetical protein